MLHRPGLGCVAAGTLAILTGCSGTPSGHRPTPLPGRHLTHAQFINSRVGAGTNTWPLSADSGTLSCVELGGQDGRREYAVVFTTEDGVQYALNGTAEHTGRYQPGIEIYAPGVYSPQPQPDATSLIGYGLSLCPNYRPEDFLTQ